MPQVTEPGDSPGRQSGFTITELMIGLVLMGILMSIATPSFQALSASNAVKSAASALQTSLLLARSEAVKRSDVVHLRANAKWSDGWSLTDNAGNFLQVMGATPTVEYQTNTAAITFDRSGRVQGNLRPQFELMHKDKVGEIRCLRVDLSGRARLEAGKCA